MNPKSENNLSDFTTNIPFIRKEVEILILDPSLELLKSIDNYLTTTKTLVASDGQTGFDLAKNNIPDLIICDYSIIENNKFYFYDSLKNNLLTAEIPIIVLSESVDNFQLAQLKSLKINQFIVKPLNIEELKLRIDFITITHQTSSGTVEKKIDTTKNDNNFLNKVENIIYENLSDESFNIETISKSLLISQKTLNRKIKTDTGLTVSELILKCKMRMAGKLLLKRQYSIAEVRFFCGFKSASYFSKTFKKFYLVSPSEF